MSMLCDGLAVGGMEDAVYVEARFYHALAHLRSGILGQHDGMYYERYDIEHRKVKKDMETPQKHDDLVRQGSRFEKDDIESNW